MIIFFMIAIQPQQKPIQDGVNFDEIKKVSKLQTIKPVGNKPAKTVSTVLPAIKETSAQGNKYDWMRQAGIPESDWQYVDYIVGRESGWNPNAINPNGGACGLAQALPCSKLGTEWNNPVHALKWQHTYVTQRYGGYAQAYAFWTQNHWY